MPFIILTSCMFCDLFLPWIWLLLTSYLTVFFFFFITLSLYINHMYFLILLLSHPLIWYCFFHAALLIYICNIIYPKKKLTAKWTRNLPGRFQLLVCQTASGQELEKTFWRYFMLLYSFGLSNISYLCNFMWRKGQWLAFGTLQCYIFFKDGLSSLSVYVLPSNSNAVLGE